MSYVEAALSMQLQLPIVSLTILQGMIPYPSNVDKKFNGILDQGEGVLIVFEEAVVEKTYETALDVITSMSKVVDNLYQKAKKPS